MSASSSLIFRHSFLRSSATVLSVQCSAAVLRMTAAGRVRTRPWHSGSYRCFLAASLAAGFVDLLPDTFHSGLLGSTETGQGKVLPI
jgi:hypothetical protein